MDPIRDRKLPVKGCFFAYARSMRRLAALILTTALILQNSPLVYAVNVRVSLPQGGMTIGGAAGGAVGQKTGSLQLDTLVPGSLTLGSVLPGTQSFSASVNTRPEAQKTVAASVAMETPQEKGALAEFPANVTRGPPSIIPDSGTRTRTRTPLRTGRHKLRLGASAG